jgi:hypothetical protein
MNTMSPAERDILDAAPKIALDDRDGWRVAKFLAETYRHYFNKELWDFGEEDAKAVLHEGGLNVSFKRLFDIPHDSDESCEGTMLLVDNKPAALWLQIGDKSDYSDGFHVLNGDAVSSLASRVAMHEMKKTMDNRDEEEPVSWLSLIHKHANYMDFVSSTVFRLSSPKWSFCIPVDQYDAYYWDPLEGKPKRVLKFGKWHDPRNTYSKDDNPMAAVVGEDGPCDIDMRTLVFCLRGSAKSKDELNTVWANYRRDPYWVASSANYAEFEGIHIYEHVPYSFEVKSSLLVFKDRATRDACLADLDKKEFDGCFREDHPVLEKHVGNLCEQAMTLMRTI